MLRVNNDLKALIRSVISFSVLHWSRFYWLRDCNSEMTQIFITTFEVMIVQSGEFLKAKIMKIKIV